MDVYKTVLTVRLSLKYDGPVTLTKWRRDITSGTTLSEIEYMIDNSLDLFCAENALPRNKVSGVLRLDIFSNQP